VSHDGTRQLAHSEGEYIHPENAGGIGSILILLGLVTEIEILSILSIVGFVLWLISIYQLSKKLEKPSIFQKVLIGLILAGSWCGNTLRL
jgi:uncharacterized membrane protein